MVHTEKPLRVQDTDKEVWAGAGEALSPNASSPFPPEPPETSGSVIPVYCALLSAVVLGLLAYVAFKGWRSRQQRQQLAKVPTAELGALDRVQRPGEDGAIFLPSPGGHSPDPNCQLYLHLPRKRQEEVERLLEAPGEPHKGWRALARVLGYEDEAVETLAGSQEPASTLLRGWAAREGSPATVGALQAALAALGRGDVVQVLGPVAEGEAVV